MFQGIQNFMPKNILRNTNVKSEPSRQFEATVVTHSDDYPTMDTSYNGTNDYLLFTFVYNHVFGKYACFGKTISCNNLYASFH